MNILVIGGAGYIGSILVPMLLRHGNRVTVLDQRPLPGEPSVDNLFELVGDCRDGRLVADLLKDNDIIIPLAALVGAPVCASDESGAVSTNLDAVSELIGYIGIGLKKIIYPNTNAGYSRGLASEDTPMLGESLYARTKIEAERLLLGCGAVSLRLGSVFGASPAMRTATLLNWLVYAAVKKGSVILKEADHIRTFLHVSDAARAFEFVIENYRRMEGRPFNVNLPGISKRSVCKLIAEQVPFTVEIDEDSMIDPDGRDFDADCSRIRALGYNTTVGIREGIRELIEAYKSGLKGDAHGLSGA